MYSWVTFKFLLMKLNFIDQTGHLNLLCLVIYWEKLNRTAKQFYTPEPDCITAGRLDGKIIEELLTDERHPGIVLEQVIL